MTRRGGPAAKLALPRAATWQDDVAATPKAQFKCKPQCAEEHIVAHFLIALAAAVVAEVLIALLAGSLLHHSQPGPLSKQDSEQAAPPAVKGDLQNRKA